ncbi:transketolase, pyrimidine binding domain protein [Achromobacter xylosoxidans A8]|uniref:Transketolase, pyrimidine binding domain protein n=1 Tax=Achromobacter xylosoxidans (strain A8) TaxID=762376 RepID=E3HQH1_ACHXA|nr:transketolase [Achromobacter xylosoxidans]ADP19605.1 transketolase, pyrimidine binding domain protein [Achromobacter xylosoxidans A8]
MRVAFAQAIIAQYKDDPSAFFLTGDLGFMALEEVRESLGPRFVNMGVSEQNMVGVAAGLAREGLKPFVYSIAPFCYARPYEQIRNDICFGQLSVCLVGNGGGYAYGYMGPTHHALEDCAAMNALGVRVLVPAFDDDLPTLISHIHGPTYLRLGYDARPKGATVEPYAAWRKVLPGDHGILLALGPLAGVAWEALQGLPKEWRPAVWAVCELPFGDVPVEILAVIASGQAVYIVEEHVAAGGLGMQFSLALATRACVPASFNHRHASGHAVREFGSQAFHRAQCGLDVGGILAMVEGT